MSSNEEDYVNDFHRGKKRRIQRACDVCRRRKSRCDGSGLPGDKCSTCIDANLNCTYQEGAVKRVPAKNSYVESLEARLEHSEALVRQLRSELASAAFAKPDTRAPRTNGNGDTSSTPDSMASGSGADSEERMPQAASLHIMRAALRSIMAPEPPPHADDLSHIDIAQNFEKLNVNGPTDRRFIGKSSGATLIKAAIDLKEDVRRQRRAGSEDAGPGNIHHQSPEARSDDPDEDVGFGPWRSRRLWYWAFKPWENTNNATRTYNFPEPDLAARLIDLYFAHVNIYLPLLHRPTFERSVKEGLHYRDDGFAATLLLVCAVASRWSDDPRVVPPPGTDNRARLSCGFQWFDQVPLVGNHLFGQATLYDLQYYCLAVQFLEGSSAPQACWTIIGVGLRLAQDVGAHRRSARVEKPSVQGELWKRAFWVLVYMDRAVSSGMGRPCGINHDEFDLAPLVECDDEYWDHPTRPFQQPSGVPSRVAFFNALLRLNHILSFSLKLLYSLTKVRVVFGVDDAWEEQTVAELDSALNLWRDQVPEHLRWDPGRADPVFFNQSVALQCHYSHLQILIHRPFIPMLRNSAPTALPSLAICTSAARTCANMADIQRRRNGKMPVVFSLHAVFTSGIILLLNVWSGKRTGLVPDPSREIANVHKCMEVVRLCEERWQSAGLLWDILYELASVGQLPLPKPSPPPACDDNAPVPPQVPATAPPLEPRGATIPRCQVEPMPPDVTNRIHLGARGLRQTFDRPVNDPQFRAPYTEPPPFQGSFAGAIGMSAPSSRALGVAPMEPSAFAPPPAPDAWFPPEDPYAGLGAPAQASRELEDMMNLIDSDTIAMWTNAPTGLEVDDWGNYFNSFGEITQGQGYGS